MPFTLALPCFWQEISFQVIFFSRGDPEVGEMMRAVEYKPETSVQTTPKTIPSHNEEMIQWKQKG
jgi:hypothetical protein